MKGIAVLGDVNVDILMKVKYVPTEDIAVAADEAVISYGGVGGNVSVALRRLGNYLAYLLAAVGNDLFGKAAIKELSSEGVVTDYVKVVPNSSTGFMVIMITEGGRRSIVGFRGANTELRLSSDDLNDVVSKVVHAHASGYVALNSDGGESLINYLRVASREGLSTSLDLEGIANQRQDLVNELKGLITYAFINRDELMALIRSKYVVDAGKELLRVLRPKVLFIKLGSEGSLVITGKYVRHVEAFKVNAVDTTGAGDSFNAGVIHALISNYTPYEAALLGNALGAYTCLGWGARYLPKSLKELTEVFPRVGEVIK